MPAAPRQKLPDFKAYIQIDLTEEDISRLEHSEVTPEQTLVFVHSLARDRYRITIQADPEAKTVKVTAMDIDPTRSSAGFMLSAESTSTPDALLTLMYKHINRMNSDWRPFCNAAREVKRFR